MAAGSAVGWQDTGTGADSPLRPPPCLCERWDPPLPAGQGGKLGVQSAPPFTSTPVRFAGQGQPEFQTQQ